MALMKVEPRAPFFSKDPVEHIDLSSPYFTSHLITYIGNKRRLLPFLYANFLKVRRELGKDKLIILDGFAGSGASARLLKAFASELHVNDLEAYSETINKAYLANRSDIDLVELSTEIDRLNKNKLKGKARGFIRANY